MKVRDTAVSAAWWPEDRDHRRRLTVILLVALGLRVAWVLYAGREPTGYYSGDPQAYLFYGRELAAGRGYRSWVTHQPTAFFPIGYPLFIALFAWPVQHGLLPDDVTRLVGLAQAVLGTLTALFVWVIANRLFGARVALIAAGVVALWPGLILLTASLHLETVFVAFTTGAIAVLVGRRGDDRAPYATRRLLLGGLLLGASALVRPFSLPILGAVFVAALLTRPSENRWHRLRTALVATVLVFLPVALILAPWVARNQRELGTTALTTNLGDTFCLDHRAGAVGHFTDSPECFTGFDDVPLSDIERVRNDEGIRRALRFIRENPRTEVKLILLRARYMIDGDHDGLTGVESDYFNPFIPDPLWTALRTIADWWYWVMLVLAVPGVWAFVRRGPRRPDRTLVLLSGAALTLIPLELYGYTRFHVPVIPFQAMAAAVTIAAVANRLPRRSARPT